MGKEIILSMHNRFIDDSSIFFYADNTYQFSHYYGNYYTQWKVEGNKLMIKPRGAFGWHRWADEKQDGWDGESIIKGINEHYDNILLQTDSNIT